MKRIAAALVLMAMVATTVPAMAQDTGAASEMVRRAIHVCEACHGENGRMKDAAMPTLAGQMPQYLQRQLRDFRSQARAEASTQAYMWGVSALLDDATIEGLSTYYASLPPHAGKPGKAPLVKTGRKIFEDGMTARGIKSCAGCHGDDAEGDAGFPRLAGQSAVYLANQLKLFRNTPLRQHGVLMKKETKALSDAEIRAVAAYLQSK